MRSSFDASIARDMLPITSDDDLEQRFQGIKCKGTGGNLVVITYAGETRTIPIAAGEVEPLYVLRVLEATTATGLWGYKIFKEE